MESLRKSDEEEMMEFVDGEYTILSPIISTPEKSTDVKEEMPNPDFVSSTSADIPIFEWTIDTGAPNHATGDSSELENLRPFEYNIGMGNGGVLAVTHMGDATLNLGHLTIGLKDVLLVPEMKFNAFSVSQFTSNYPFNFEFSATGYMIKDRTTKRVIASGSGRRGGLYLLTTFKDASNQFCEVAEDIRHARLIIHHEIKPENFLFQLPLTYINVQTGSLFISPEEVRNHFPAETSHMEEMLYFTDNRNGQWFMEIGFFRGPLRLMMGAFIDEHNLGVGDMVRFYKADQPLHSRHFLIGFLKGRGDPSDESRTATALINDSTNRSGGGGGDGDREGYYANADSQHLILSSTSGTDVPIFDEWIIDTGAEKHVTGDSSKLQNLRPVKVYVSVANDDLLPVTHTGDTILNLGNLMIGLTDVLLVPEVKFNVLSVSQFTSDYPFNFEFSATGYMIKDRTTKRVVASGRRRGDHLYPLITTSNEQ